MLFLVSNGNTAAADTFAATMASNPAAVLAPGTFGAVTVTSVAQGTQSITVDPSLLTAPTGGGDGPPVGKLVGGIVGGVCGAALPVSRSRPAPRAPHPMHSQSQRAARRASPLPPTPHGAPPP